MIANTMVALITDLRCDGDTNEKFWKTNQDGGYIALVDKYFDNSFLKRMRFVFKKILTGSII